MLFEEVYFTNHCLAWQEVQEHFKANQMGWQDVNSKMFRKYIWQDDYGITLFWPIQPATKKIICNAIALTYFLVNKIIWAKEIKDLNQ